jgi:hypothetical protein
MNSEKKRRHTRIVEEEELEYRKAHCINGRNRPSHIKFVEELELENRSLKQELQSKEELELENRLLKRELRFKNKLGLLGILLTAEICKIVINKVATFVATFLRSEKEIPTKQNLILTNFI